MTRRTERTTRRLPRTEARISNSINSNKATEIMLHNNGNSNDQNFLFRTTERVKEVLFYNNNITTNMVINFNGILVPI